MSTTAFFHCVGKCSCVKLISKIYLSSGANIVEQPFVIKLGIRSSPTDLEGRRHVMAFKTSNSEMGENCEISLDNKSEPIGEDVL
jgi:hypothetical protein